MSRALGRVLLLIALPACAAPAAGQETTEPAGTVTVLDGVFTEAQADRGELEFRTSCAACHAPGFFTAGTFVRGWAGRPVRSLYRRLRQTMPEDNPGSLRPREYSAIIAYILRLNEYPPGDTALPSDEEELRRILMVERPQSGR